MSLLLPEYVNSTNLFYAGLILFIELALVVEYRRWRRLMTRQDQFAWIVVAVLAAIATPFLLATLYFIVVCTLEGGCS
jgi:SH3-like domain-containing protein